MAIVSARRQERLHIKCDKPALAAKAFSVNLLPAGKGGGDLNAVEQAYIWPLDLIAGGDIDTVIPLQNPNFASVVPVGGSGGGTAYPPAKPGMFGETSGGHMEICGISYNLGTAVLPSAVGGIVFNLVLLVGTTASLITPTALATRRANRQVIWEQILPVGAMFEREFPKIVLNYEAGVAEQARVRIYLAAGTPGAVTVPMYRNVVYIDGTFRHVQEYREAWDIVGM